MLYRCVPAVLLALALAACATLGPRVAGETGTLAWEATDLRLEQHSTLSCGPSFDSCDGPNVPISLWQIVMQGTDARGQAVRAVIDISLPPDPPAVPAKTSKSVREITLTPPKR